MGRLLNCAQFHLGRAMISKIWPITGLKMLNQRLKLEILTLLTQISQIYMEIPQLLTNTFDKQFLDIL